MSRILVCPDVHMPYHDARAWRLFLKALHQVKPDQLVIIGDFVDCYSISSHRKNPRRKSLLSNEIDAACMGLDALQDVMGHKVVFCEGNHEERLERYLCDRAPELYGMVDIRSLLTKDRGWRWVPYGDWITIGKVSFSHDVGRAGMHALRQSLVDFGDNIVIGHTHAGGTTYMGTTSGRRLVALNVGWLGDYSAINYTHKARAQRMWQHGFGLIDQDGRGRSWCQFIPIVDGQCMIDGKVIK